MVTLSSLIRAPDYPAEAIAARAQGNTGVLLTVHPSGRVTGCSVTASSGWSMLDAATCRLLVSRARFHPARDAAGNPQIGTFPTVIAWRLPQR
jgi:protein TonB